MTWLKKRLKELGLSRRLPPANYSPIPQVQAAIEVNEFVIIIIQIIV